MSVVNYSPPKEAGDFLLKTVKKVIIKDGISAEGEATMTKFTGTKFTGTVHE